MTICLVPTVLSMLMGFTSPRFSQFFPILNILSEVSPNVFELKPNVCFLNNCQDGYFFVVKLDLERGLIDYRNSRGIQIYALRLE